MIHLLLALSLLQGQAKPPYLHSGVLTSTAEVAALPMSGPAWDALLDDASEDTSAPDVSDMGDNVDVFVFAKALVFARTGTASYRDDVIEACMSAIDTELPGETLALGRNLIGYVAAADLVVLPAADDVLFRAWLDRCLHETLLGRTLISTHEDRPNNWGTHAGASRAAVDRYLGDAADLYQCSVVFRGWLGDRAKYAGFAYEEDWWQADPAHPVGINPVGALILGHNVDGVLPDDQRRGGPFTWPPPPVNYVWEALQGALGQALVLERAGFNPWLWSDKALLRAVTWLHAEPLFPATGDDTWQPWVINKRYGTSFPAPLPSNHGKNLGYYDWLMP